MQPYQKATEELLSGKRQAASVLPRALNSLLRVGVPSSIALKGLGKLNPYIQKFSKIATKLGYEEDEIVDHIRETSSEKGTGKIFFDEAIGNVDVSKLTEPAQKQLSFLKMIADKLQKKGIDKDDPQFKKLRKKIRDVINGKSSMMMEEVMRGGDELFSQQPQQMPLQPEPMAQDQQPQQIGPGQKALMDILKKIQSTRGPGG